MVRVETLASRDPHAAVFALQDSGKSICTNGADSALFELVYTESLRRQGVAVTKDSLIEQSAAFFLLCGDDLRSARALLQWGLALMDMGRYVDAADRLKQSEYVAEKCNDDALEADVAMALARLNDVAGNATLALKHGRRAVEAARRSDDVNIEATALNNLAMMYHRMQLADSFAVAAHRLRQLPAKLDRVQKASVATTVGYYFLSRGDTARAVERFESAKDLDPDRRASLFLGEVMAAKGRWDRAVALFYDASCSMSKLIRRDALRHLISHASDVGNSRSLVFLAPLLSKSYDWQADPKVVSEVVKRQEFYDSEAARRKQQRQRNVWTAVAGAAIAVFVASLLFYKARLRSLGRNLRRKEDALQTLDSRYRADMDRLKLSDQRLLSLADSDCVAALHSLARRGRQASNADWEALHRLVDEHDRSLAALIAEHKALSMAEVNVLMLVRMRFAPSEMAALLGISPQNATNLRVRLLKKVFGQKGGTQDFDKLVRAL